MALHGFRFCWRDAWGIISRGVEILLEKNCQGQASLLMLINGKPLVLPINESEFIDDLKKIKVSRWNGYEYIRYLEDGDRWSLTISFDSTYIEAVGFNGYPFGFLEFLSVLHKHGVPEISFEEYVSTKEIGQTKRIRKGL